MFAPLEHEKEGSQNLVANGNHGTFVATPDHKSLKFRLEHRRGATGGMRKLAKQTTDIEVALAHVAGLCLPADSFLIEV